jgi:hypothetical protein
VARAIVIGERKAEARMLVSHRVSAAGVVELAR